MPPKRAFIQEAPEASQALRRSSRALTPSKKVRFEEPLTDREIRIIQRGKAQKEFAKSTKKREMRPQNPKRRLQSNEAEVKARQQEEKAAAAREREKVAAETRILQEIEDRDGEDNSPVEKEGKNGDKEGESSANSDDRAEIDKLTQIRNWPFDIHLT